MTAHVVEGTWAEIVRQSDRFAGKRLRIQVLNDSPPVIVGDQEFEEALDLLAEDSEALPVLSEEATTRAGIYGDHD